MNQATAADVFGNMLITADGMVQVEHAATQAAAGRVSASLSPPSVVASTAIIPVVGPLAHHANWISTALGWSTYDGIRAAVRDAETSSGIDRIVLAINSPGGTVFGVDELADTIKASQTPVVAHTSDVMASAALWLASGANAIYSSKLAMVGSIGVRARYVEPDKADMQSSNAPKKLGTRESTQEQLDTIEAAFIAAVADGRGVDRTTVIERFGGGDVLIGQAAVDVGLIDGIATLEQVVDNAIPLDDGAGKESDIDAGWARAFANKHNSSDALDVSPEIGASWDRAMESIR
jgi:ClpP class serine protease